MPRRRRRVRRVPRAATTTSQTPTHTPLSPGPHTSHNTTAVGVRQGMAPLAGPNKNAHQTPFMGRGGCVRSSPALGGWPWGWSWAAAGVPPAAAEEAVPAGACRPQSRCR
jgi:hypothetical protein